MRHQARTSKLGRTTAHKRAMLRNMVTSLILKDRIETTLPKAKELRRWAEKMITLAKRQTLHARRQAMTVLKDRDALQKLFTTLVDRFKDRQGGYTRILKLGYRHGDSAPMAVIEYLTAEIKKAVSTEKKDTKTHAKEHAHKAKKHEEKKKIAARPAKQAKQKSATIKKEKRFVRKKAGQ